MNKYVFHILLLITPGLFAADFTLHQGAQGTKMIGVTLNDSLENFDISDILIEGYQVENAILIQDNDDALPLRLKPGVLDVGRDQKFTTRNFSRVTNVIEIEGPMDHFWQSGHIIIDTASGGYSQRILTITEMGYFADRKTWSFNVEPVTLVEIVEQLDISFTSQPEISFTKPDTQWVESIVGRENSMINSRWTEAQFEVQMENFQAHLKPRISGRLRVVRGVIEINELSISGVYEINSNLSTRVSKPGVYNYSHTFPLEINHTIPIDSGLVLSFVQGMGLEINMSPRGNDFRSYSEIKVIQEFQSQLKYFGKTWMLISNEMNVTPISVSSSMDQERFFSSGRVNVGIVPYSNILWNGENGIELKIKSFSNVVQDSSHWTASNRTLTNGLSLSARSAGAFELNTPRGVPLEFGEIEKIIGRPPVLPLNIIPADARSGSLTFEWIHDPAADKYLVETKIGESWIRTDSILAPPLQLTGLQQLTRYEYRIIPVNRMGAGLPTLVEGTTLRLNLPPEIPQIQFPVDGDTVGSMNINFSWIAKDPDSVEALKYIMLLDTVDQPERAVLNYGADKQFFIEKLEPGKTYYWRIRVVDGLHKITGPVWKFYIPSENDPRDVNGLSHPFAKTELIESGEFTRSDAKKVKVDAFYMHKFEVTQKEFNEVMNYNPSYWKGDNLPVESINWGEANKYCREIGGRLPTESEWEFATRGGTSSNYYWKEGRTTDYAWYFQNSGKKTHEVGLKKPNEYGLYDMSGNVFEWTADWYGFYATDNLVNPKGVLSGTKKVTRGGSWYSDATNLKSSVRFMNRPGFSSFKLGMRCAFSVPE